MKSLVQRLRAELLDLFTGTSELAAARAKHLQDNIVIALFGSLGTSITLVLFMWRDDLKLPLIVWLVCSHIPALIRLWLWRAYAAVDFEQTNNHGLAKFYLRISTLATFIAGIVFGFGWAYLVPYVDVNGQLIYLLAVIALLFGGLYTYSPNFITYLVFSVSAIWLVPFISLFVAATKIENLNFFIVLISLLSTMFGMRFSLSFQHNYQLRKNVEHLLDEVTYKHQQAVEANAEKSKFLASVSHDLRQPMHAISLNVATIASSIDQHAVAIPEAFFLKEQTNRLRTNVNYLNEMFEALLDMSRLDAGVTTIDLRAIDLIPIIERLDAEFQLISQELQIPFSVNYNKSHNYHAVADASAVDRILRNLISNAFKHTRSGGVRLSIQCKDNSIHIRVVDTGVGIDKNSREKIFQDFVQIQRDKVASELQHQFGHSFGLGLGIARRLANRLNSEIMCRSWVSKGSVFSFALPLAELAPVDLSATHSAAVQAQFNTALIVIIDDDTQIVESTSSLLQLKGFKVISASGSAEAIKKCHNTDKRPDLLLCDFRLLNETGVEAISLIQEEFNYDIPAIIVTGETSSDAIQAITHLGYKTLFKPLSSDSLLHSIQEILAVSS
jgi:signal transduction histidine kinase/ActR/RegA family two-component response regulator